MHANEHFYAGHRAKAGKDDYEGHKRRTAAHRLLPKPGHPADEEEHEYFKCGDRRHLRDPKIEAR